MKSQPLSIRLSADTERLVAEEARRTRRSKGSVVEALTQEALRCRLFPGIAFRGDDWDRRPWVIGSGLDIWEIVQGHQDLGGDPAATLAQSELSEQQLRVALAYYDRFPEEVDEAIRSNRRSPNEWHRLHPTFDVLIRP